MTNRLLTGSLLGWGLTHYELNTPLPVFFFSTGLLLLSFAVALGYRVEWPTVKLPIRIVRDDCPHTSLSVGAHNSVHCVSCGLTLAESALEHLDLSKGQSFKAYRKRETVQNNKLVEVIEPHTNSTKEVYQPTLPGITGLKNPFQALLDEKSPPKQQPQKRSKKQPKKSPQKPVKGRKPPPAGPLPFKTIKRS